MRAGAAIALAELPVGENARFERLGYFWPDPDSAPDRFVFNRTFGLGANVQAKELRQEPCR
jgi:hypothetical protein